MIYYRDNINNLDSYINLIESHGYKYHHTSLRRGYAGVREFIHYVYNGKFGHGVAVLGNNKASSNYCFISYYVKDCD